MEYTLTKEGESLRPILESMFDWGIERLEKEGLHPCCSMMEDVDK
ncbi:winged helix-turn-helix transcriptional regulator [Christensenella hongkongensis]